MGCSPREVSNDLYFGPRGAPYLLPVLLVLDGIHSAAGFGVQHEVKAGVFAETTRVAQEGVLLVVIDGPEAMDDEVV